MLISRLSGTAPGVLLQCTSASYFLGQESVKDRRISHFLVRYYPSSSCGGLRCQGLRGFEQNLRKGKRGVLCELSFPTNGGGDGDEDVDKLKVEKGIFEAVKIFEQEIVADEPDGVTKGSLIPAEWKFIQEDLNKSKSQKRKEIKAQHVEFAKNRELGERSIVHDGVDTASSGRLRQKQNDTFKRKEVFSVEKRALQNFDNHWRDGHVVIPDEPEIKDSNGDNGTDLDRRKYDSPQRATPKDPRLQLGDDTLEDLAKRMEYLSAESKEHDAKEVEKLNKVLSIEEKSLLKAKIPDLKKLTGKKWLPLHTLSASGRTIMVAELLSHGVDINATDKDGLTALHKAITSGKETMLKQLIRAGANVFVQDKDGASLLHYAVHYGNTGIAKVLLKNNVDVNHPDNDGWTPLHVAVPSGKTELIKLLLKHGADKNLVNRDGNRPLDMALAFGRGFCSYHVVKVLKFFPKEETDLGAPLLEGTGETFLIPTV